MSDVARRDVPALPGLSAFPELNVRTFLEHLARDWPEQLTHYERLYGGSAYLPARVADPVRTQVTALREQHGIADRRANPLALPAAPAQLALAI
jgi:hypothetical protein